MDNVIIKLMCIFSFAAVVLLVVHSMSQVDNVTDDVHNLILQEVNGTQPSKAGSQNFKEITDELYYDTETRIVWLCNDTYGVGMETYIPYFGSSGSPFKYNAETGCLELDGPYETFSFGSASLYGTDNFKDISADLAYDTMTEIVWQRNDSAGIGKDVWVPYYASNGLPYKYNRLQDCIVEIVFDGQQADDGTDMDADTNVNAVPIMP